jgi:uncharacterized protein (TIGR03086 family)
MTALDDPRPLYRRALTWVTSLLAGLRPDQLEQPTGCPDFDVRALAGHLVATVERARVIGEGGGPFSVPHVITGIPDTGWAEAYADAARTMWTVWDDDGTLTATVQAPWGTIPGSAALWGYLNETLVHGWDLATATGQDPEADPDVVAPVLAVAAQIIPAEPRGGQIPFAGVVAPAEGAGPTERLANWNGRRRPPA